VKTAAVATPLAFVVAVFTPLAKVPLAPLPGAVNVTVTALTRLLKASFAVACKFVAKAVFTVVLCGVPAVAVIEAAVPADTAIVPEVPVIELLTVSVAVMVWLPAVFNVALKVLVPFVRVELAGSEACPSVLVNFTVPV
jgi:hypothetical protein